ncbi:MAG: hypothetical protein LBV69_10005 [Bacteroidales bacterium]|jgi:hypothetical protein|nr:hypothetical protein [Bacteroidales bacterium]
MKTFKILFAFIAVIATTTIFTSCEDSEKDLAKPVITFGTTTNQVIGDALPYHVNLAVTVQAEGKIKLTTVRRYNDGTLDAVTTAKLTKDVDGDNGKTNFDFAIIDDIASIEFNSSVRYEVVIDDKEGQQTVAEFIYLRSAETYAVTFSVSPDNATVTIGSEEKTSADGNIVFHLANGTYTYTVTAGGYLDAEGDVVVSGEAVTKIITLMPSTSSLSAWSESIKIGLHATGVTAAFPINGAYIYGFEYTSNTPTAIKLVPYNNAQFVIVNDDNYATKEALIADYTSGNKVTEVLVDFDYNTKVYSKKYFISKVGENYFLIQSMASKVNTTTGNYFEFQEKH